jgi:hypothetical protein
VVSTARTTHRAYGLRIRSEVPLTSLESAPLSGSVDVEIEIGETPEHLATPTASGVRWELDEHQILIQVGRVARCLISDGRRVTVTPSIGATSADLRFAIVNGALGPVLHQRGVLVLHASAIDTPGGAIAFAGHSGIGKSTLALAMMKKGSTVLCDDVAAITALSANRVGIEAGAPTLNVWRDTANHLRYPVDADSQIRPAVPKFMIPVAATQRAAPGPLTLSAIVILEAHALEGITHQMLTGRAAFAALRNYTRGLRVAEMVQRELHFSLIAQVASRVKVHLVRRPKGNVESVDALADFISSTVCP